MRVLIACDKFRGSLTAVEANAAVARGLERSALAAQALSRPIADGGEGTLAALATADMVSVPVMVSGPFGEPLETALLYDPSRRLAVIEMASVAGHASAAARGYDPDAASSAGVGELIAAAAERGADKVTVAVGGSITVDAGAGALEALGAVLRDAAGAPVTPAAGRNLARIAHVDLAPLPAWTRGLTIEVAADVDNPLAGENGAAAVFGPQKGVAPGDVAAFDAALAHFDEQLAAATGRQPLARAPFAGAAGGILVGLAAIAPTTARDGFDLVAEHHRLDDLVKTVDLVVTGEGSLDSQSLSGKGPVAIARLAKAAGRPALAFAGRLAVPAEDLAVQGLAAFPIAREPMDLDQALAQGNSALEEAAANAFNLISLLEPSRRTDRP